MDNEMEEEEEEEERKQFQSSGLQDFNDCGHSAPPIIST